MTRPGEIDEARAESASPEPGAPRLLDRTDLLTMLGLCLVATAIYLSHGFNGTLTRDQSIYTYAGQTVADGLAPYLGIVNRAGPLSHVIPAVGVLGARLVGADDLLGVRVLFMLLSIATIAACYVLGKVWLGSRAGAIFTSLGLLSAYGFTHFATEGPREKTAMVLLLVIAMILVRLGRWFSAGVTIAAATLVWQPILLPALALAVAAALLGRTGWFRALLLVAGGGLLPLAGFLAWYAAIGRLQEFLDCFLLIHVHYTYQSGLKDDPGYFLQLMHSGFDGTEWLLFAGALLTTVAGVIGVVRLVRRSPTPIDRAMVAAMIGLIVGIIWSIWVFNGWPDVMFLLPFTALGWGWAAQRLVELLRAPRVAVALLAAAAVAAVAWSGWLASSTRSDGLIAQKAQVADMLAAVPGATMESMQAPQPMVLAGQTNPTQHQTFALGLAAYVDDTWPGGLEGYAADLVERSPTFIVAGGGTQGWLAPVIADNYWFAGSAPGWNWYVSKSVGWETRERLREISLQLPCVPGCQDRYLPPSSGAPADPPPSLSTPSTP